MNLRLLITAAFCSTVLTSPLLAAGTTSAQFLRINKDARTAAMGGIGATLRDVRAIETNPAGITRIEHQEAIFTYTSWLEGINFQNLSYARRVGEQGVGLSATYLSVPSIDKYDNTGTFTGDSYAPNDLAVGVAYARDIYGFPVGGQVKYISSKLDDKTATAFALDIGTMIDNIMIRPNERISVGFAIQNIGTEMKFDKESYGLPLNVKLGASYYPRDNFELELDLNKPVDTDLIANLGLEYLFRFDSSSLALRAGYKTDNKGIEGLSGVSGGVGIGLGNKWMLDYAFVPYGDLDNTHRVSLKFTF